MVDREPKESRVSVTVHIRDRNDNRPEFESTQYVIFVSESLPLGGNVTQVTIICIYDLDEGPLIRMSASPYSIQHQSNGI